MIRFIKRLFRRKSHLVLDSRYSLDAISREGGLPTTSFHNGESYFSDGAASWDGTSGGYTVSIDPARPN